MFRNKCLHISFYCIVFLKLSGQTISTKVDTFNLIDTLSMFSLSKKFVVESSVISTINGKNEDATIINVENSIISLSGAKKNDEVIIKYQFLNSGLPIKVGPKWKDLPKINNSDDLVLEKSFLVKDKMKEDQDLFSSGSVFRKINFSPYGSSDLTGGLQMQINGKLGHDIIISGVLSDQDIPIQPEGITKELEEIDKVFIAVRHPIFTLDVGDIVFKDSTLSIDIEKKLTGIQNTFSSNKISSSSVYAGSKGTFHSQEIYGRDGDQGPYQLKSKSGNKEIIILSGTEKIWLDGKKLVRGEMFDYTIDYSLGRVFFTPKNLIHNDMRILFEYQYSDFSYEKNFIGGTFQRKGIKNKSLISFGIYKESDIYKEINLVDELNESLLYDDSGVIKRSTVIKNKNGDYFLQDSVYVFDSMKIDSLSQRYSIVFNYNPEGNYRKRISNMGKVFYEYISNLDRNNNTDYYSPFDVSFAPRNLQFSYLNGKYAVNKYFNVNTQLRSSTKNLNLLKSGLKKSGQAYTFEMNIDSIKVLDNILKFKFNQQTRDDNFYSLGRENVANKSKLWNLDTSIVRGIKEQSVISSLENPSIGKITLNISNLESQSFYRSRFKINSYFNHNKIQGSYLDFLEVNSNKNQFYRLNSYLQVKNKYLTPYISFIKELETLNEKYFKVKGGFKIKSNKWVLESGIEKRTDEKYIFSPSLINCCWSFCSAKRVNFRRAKFGAGAISFKMALFGDADVIFDETEFGNGNLSLLKAEARKISFKNCRFSNYADMRVEKCKVLDLSNTIIRDIIDLKPGVSKVDIDTLYIYGVKNLGKIFVSWRFNNIPKLIGQQTKTTPLQKADQYRILKEDFHDSGQYNDEDKAYVEFKRYELKYKTIEKIKKNKWSAIWAYPSAFAQKLVFDYMGLYATSPFRVLFSIYMVYGLYSLLYVLFELTGHGQISCITENMSAWEKIIDSFYFSAVTFLTIGYGECTPEGFFKIIAPLEGWIGVFMMSYFTVAFVRKILR